MQKQDIFNLVQKRFNLNAEARQTTFVKLWTHGLMESSNYPRFTMLCQLLAYQITCFEALSAFPCDVFVDTVGVGFAYPMIKLIFGVKVVSYTHYPTISTDMLK